MIIIGPAPPVAPVSQPSVTVSSAEIDVGESPVAEHIVTITDAHVTPGVPVACQVSAEPEVGERSDDVTIESYQVFARCLDGAVEITLRCVGGLLMGVYRVNYVIGVV